MSANWLAALSGIMQGTAGFPQGMQEATQNQYLQDVLGQRQKAQADTLAVQTRQATETARHNLATESPSMVVPSDLAKTLGLSVPENQPTASVDPRLAPILGMKMKEQANQSLMDQILGRGGMNQPAAPPTLGPPAPPGSIEERVVPPPSPMTQGGEPGMRRTNTIGLGPSGPTIHSTERSRTSALDQYVGEATGGKYYGLSEVPPGEIATVTKAARDIATKWGGEKHTTNIVMGGQAEAQKPVNPADHLNWYNAETGQTGVAWAQDFKRANGRLPSATDFAGAGMAHLKGGEKRVEADQRQKLANFHFNEMQDIAGSMMRDEKSGRLVPLLPHSTQNATQDALNGRMALANRQLLGESDPLLARIRNLDLSAVFLGKAVAPDIRTGAYLTQQMKQIIGNMMTQPVTYEAFMAQINQMRRLTQAAAAYGGTGAFPVPQEPNPLLGGGQSPTAPAGNPKDPMGLFQ